MAENKISYFSYLQRLLSIYGKTTFSDLLKLLNATAEQLHSTKFWEGANFTPCENKALSFLSQFDLRWQMDKVSNRTPVIGSDGNVVKGTEANGTFANACNIFVTMGIWCSLNNVTVADARDFIEICRNWEEIPLACENWWLIVQMYDRIN